MPTLLDRLYARIARGHGTTRTARRRRNAVPRSTCGCRQYLIPAVESGSFGYGGNRYPYGLQTTYAGQRVQESPPAFPGTRRRSGRALRRSPPRWSAPSSSPRPGSRSGARRGPRTPGKRFANPDLPVLEQPWPNAHHRRVAVADGMACRPRRERLCGPPAGPAAGAPARLVRPHVRVRAGTRRPRPRHRRRARRAWCTRTAGSASPATTRWCCCRTSSPTGPRSPTLKAPGSACRGSPPPCGTFRATAPRPATSCSSSPTAPPRTWS